MRPRLPRTNVTDAPLAKWKDSDMAGDGGSAGSLGCLLARCNKDFS